MTEHPIVVDLSGLDSDDPAVIREAIEAAERRLLAEHRDEPPAPDPDAPVVHNRDQDRRIDQMMGGPMGTLASMGTIVFARCTCGWEALVPTAADDKDRRAGQYQDHLAEVTG